MSDALTSAVVGGLVGSLVAGGFTVAGIWLGERLVARRSAAAQLQQLRLKRLDLLRRGVTLDFKLVNAAATSDTARVEAAKDALVRTEGDWDITLLGDPELMLRYSLTGDLVRRARMGARSAKKS